MTPTTRLNKIAEITVFFWISKVIATTLGETGGDFLAQTLGLGYVIGFLVTTVLLAGILVAQIRARSYHSGYFWASIVATTTAGTEISDMMDRTFGFGYVLGSSLLFAALILTLSTWYGWKRSLSVEPITDRQSEMMFWIAVLFSNSLGTAFGDALIDPIGLNFIQGALVCMVVIGAVLMVHYFTKLNASFLFWVAFVFTRPFGATFGNFLVKEHARGGLELGTLETSAVATALLVAVVFLSSRLGRKSRFDPSGA